MIDDGSCAIGGCTLSTSLSFNPSATFEDGSCGVDYYGCTDSTAANYRVVANREDGSCTFSGCKDPTADNYDQSATLPNLCVFPIHGCTDTAATNYYAQATVSDGSCFYTGCTDSIRNNYNPTATVDDGRCTPLIPGCTDPAANNYNLGYNIDDGSCSYPGCNTNGKCNYDSGATFNDGTCALTTLEMCIVSGSFNDVDGFGLGANDVKATLSYRGQVRIDAPEISNDNSPVWNSCVTFEDEKHGTIHVTATDVDALRDDDLGENYIEYPFPVGIPIGNQFEETLSLSEGSLTISVTATCSSRRQLVEMAVDKSFPRRLATGCLDPAASNYAASASSHDQSTCSYIVLGCTDLLALNYNFQAEQERFPSECTFPVYGCTLSDGTLNYDSLATVLSSCRLAFRGCTDSAATNYNVDANSDDGTCYYVAYGCVDEAALNYNTLASILDDSCTYPVPGCSDSEANNYASDANIEDPQNPCKYTVRTLCPHMPMP